MNTNERIIVKIVVPNVNGKAIAQSGDQIFILPADGYHKDEEVFVNRNGLIKVPSMLYALSIVFDDNFADAVKFIKENM
jgi:hypothetical protein